MIAELVRMIALLIYCNPRR